MSLKFSTHKGIAEYRNDHGVAISGSKFARRDGALPRSMTPLRDGLIVKSLTFNLADGPLTVLGSLFLFKSLKA